MDREKFSGKISFLKERWISAFSFMVAVLFHVLLISLGTRHYLGSPVNPAGANQAVQKLDEAIKNKKVQFVYVKDDPNLPPVKPAAPGAPLSDRDRAGASPDGGKGTSRDPYSR